MNWGRNLAGIFDAHASQLRALRHKANIKIRKVLVASFIASMVVTVGPAIDVITAPAANAAVTNEAAINVGRNTTVNEPFTWSVGGGNFAVYIKLVNPASGQYLTMDTTFSTREDYFGGSRSNFTEAVLIGTAAEFNSTFNAGSGKFKLVTGASANSNTSIRWKLDQWDSSYVYSSTNKHFYKYVSVSGTSWSSAATIANATSFLGAKGYLASITSSTENTEIVNVGVNNAGITSGSYWIGAGDNLVEGVWRWTSSNTNAPEAGKVFYTQRCVKNKDVALTASEITSTSCSDSASYTNTPQGYNYTADGFNYSSWNGGEPNNADGSQGEDYATLILNSNIRGQWNDLRDGNAPNGYIIEFGEAELTLQPSDYNQKAITSFAFSSGYSALTTTFGTAATSTTPGTTGGRSNVSYSINNLGRSAISINSSTGVVTVSSSATTADNGTYTVTATENSGTPGDAFTTTTTIAITVNKVNLSAPGSLTLSATSGASKSINASWSNVSNESGFTITLLEGTTVRATIPLAADVLSRVITTSDYSGFADNTSYTVSVVAVGNATQYETSTATTATVTTNQSARTATFGTATRRSLGFTVPISNYDASFTYETVTSSAGTATLSGSNIVVTNLSRGAGAAVSISTRKTGFVSTTTTSGTYFALETATALALTPKSLTAGRPYRILYSADASNPNKPTYTSSTTSVCTVSGETITPLTSGTCTINATLVGYSTFDTTTATANFTVFASLSNPGFGFFSTRFYTTSTETFTWQTNGGVSPYTVTLVNKTTGLAIPGIQIGATTEVDSTIRRTPIVITQYTGAMNDTVTITVIDANGATLVFDTNLQIYKDQPGFTITASETETSVTKQVTFTVSTSKYNVTGSVSLQYSSGGSYVNMAGCTNIPLVNGSMTCTWTSAVSIKQTIVASYSGDSNYKSSAEASLTSGPFMTINDYVAATYPQLTLNFGVGGTRLPNLVLNGTGSKSSWNWEIVRTSDSATVSGISMNLETITVASSVPVGTYNLTVRVTDSKGITAHLPATVVINKGTTTISLSIDSSSVTVGKTTTIRITASAAGVTGTVTLHQGNSTTLVAGCESVTLVNSQATCQATSLSAYGPTTIFYTYLGDSNYSLTARLSTLQNIQFFPRTSLSYSSTTTNFGTAATFVGTYTTRGGGAANTWVWSIVRTSDSSTVSGISISGETITVSNTVPAGTYPMTITTIDGLGDTTVRNVTITVSPLTGLNPSFGTVTRTANGFTSSITNFNADYSFVITVSAGSIETGTVSGSTLPLRVTGLSDSQSATISITTSRLNYTSLTNTQAGTSLGAGITPSFGTPTKIAGGFTVSINNYSASYVWSESVTAGTVTAGTPSGSNRTYTVTGLSPGQSATLFVSDTSTTTRLMTNSVIGSSLASQAAVSLTTTSGTYPGETLTATGGTGTGALTYSLSGTSVATTETYTVSLGDIIGSAVTPDGNFLYVFDFNGGQSSRIRKVSTSSGSVLATIDLGFAPGRQIAISPDSSYVLIPGSGKVLKLNVATDSFTVLTSNVSFGYGIAISPLGNGNFYVVDAGTMKVLFFNSSGVNTSTVNLVGYSDIEQIVVSPDGNFLYVADKGANHKIDKISISSASVVQTYTLSGYSSTNDAKTMAISPDGKILALGLYTSRRVWKVDLLTGVSSVSSVLSGASGVIGLTIDRDNNAYVASQSDGKIYQVNLSDLSSSSIVNLASTKYPTISSDLSTLYFLSSTSLIKRRLATAPGSAKCSISGTRITAQSAGTCSVIATRAADADYLTESSTATTFTFNAASALRIAAVAGTVNFRPTAQYSPRSTFTGFVSSDTGTVSSLTYSYAGISGTTYGPSATIPTAVGTYSVTPAGGTISMTSGFVAGYASPNSYISDTLTVQATVPDSVTAVSVTTTTSTSATLSFAAPVNDGGATITSYVVSSGTDTVTASASSSPVTITGLSPGTAYTFRVNAINSAGRSDTATATQVYTRLGVTLNTSSVTGYFGTPIETITPTVRGGSGITYSVSPTLPAGLSLSAAGVISGTPTETRTLTTFTETATFSTFTTGTATFTLTILKGDSSISTPTISPSSPILGQPLTFTSTVTSVNSRATLTGTVTFRNGSGTSLCETTTITLGVASCSFTPLTTDTFTVRAFYGGMTFIDTSTSSALTVVPTKANPSITAATTTPFIRTVDTATITATIVTGTATNATGNVSFTIGDSAISGCSSRSVSSNIATCVFTPPSTGVFSIVATYAGDLNYNGAAASSTSVTVSLCTQSVAGTITVNTGAPAAGYCAVSITAATSGSLGLPVGVTSMKSRVLIIGGGGSGGSRHGGGGGAGSVLYSTSFEVSETSTVTIGTGGSPVTNTRGQSGNPTTFGSVVAAGGGAGGGADNGVGLSGGSGGGGAATNSGASGAQTTVTGFAAYVGSGVAGRGGGSANSYTGGGGGGAGGNGSSGENGSPAIPGSGGAGIDLNMTLDGTTACFAGGGGGGQYSAEGKTTPGQGGGCGSPVTTKVGGDGNVASGTSTVPTVTSAQSGRANTGSGGGGGGFASVNYASGAGGSGLVALRYISAPTITVPVDATVASLANVSLAATVPLFGNLFTRTYQWQKFVGSSWRNETSTSATTLTLAFVARFGDGATQRFRLLVTDSDGTLSTTTASRTITLTVTPLTQPPLYLGSTYGVAGTPLPLFAFGGAGTGTTSFAFVSQGSAATCSLSGSTLSLATAGICRIVATKSADFDYLIARTETVTVSFVTFQVAVQPAPTNTSTGIQTSGGTTPTKGSGACVTGCVPRIISISVLSARESDTVVITGLSLSSVDKVYFRLDTTTATSDVEGTNVTIVSDTQMSARVPSGLIPGEFYTIRAATQATTSARFYDIEILP